MKLSVIIPAYKNKQMLMKNLRTNYPYIKDCQVIIVDDASGENIEESVRQEFSGVTVITNQKNIGFGESVNVGVKQADSDFIMLLNNDVVLFDDSFYKALRILKKNEDHFGVSFLQKESYGNYVGGNGLFIRRGFILNRKVDDLETGLNAWAEGGSCVLRKKYFEQLGGFSPLFSPAYYEDIDLSYRAYKRGFKVCFYPDIIVEHHHESTTGAVFSKDYKKILSYRNHFIFMWKNMTDTSLLINHILFLPYYFVKHFLAFDKPFFVGFCQAVMKLPEIIESRKVESKHIKVSDSAVVKMLN